MSKNEIIHYCRNKPRCGMQLKEPAGNPHAAFCCRGCWEQFHRTRCIVCERQYVRTKPIPLQVVCGRRDCKNRLRQNPWIYRPFDHKTTVQATQVPDVHSEATETLVNRGSGPVVNVPRGWHWRPTGGSDDDWFLYNRENSIVARVRPEASQYWVGYPRAIPEPPLESRDMACKRAMSLALAALPR